MMSNYSLSDVAAVTDKNGQDSSFFWIFALLILGGGGFGGLGNRGVSEVTGFQMGELSGKVATQDGLAMLQNSTNQGFAGLNTVVSNGFSTVTITLADRIASVASAVASCCCELQRQMADGFGQIRYDMATLNAQTNANIAEWGNRILTDNSRRAEMAQAQRINQLELQSALCGVVRYPNQQTFNAGPYPIPQGPHGYCQ